MEGEATHGAGDLGALPKKRRNQVGRKKTCYFPGCGPTSLKCHKMPKDPHVREAWMEALGANGDKADYRVCEAHFAPSDYVPGVTRRGSRVLKPEAVPKPKDEVDAMEVDTGESDTDLNGELNGDVVEDADVVENAAVDKNAVVAETSDNADVEVVDNFEVAQMQEQIEALKKELSSVKRENFLVKDENVRLRKRVEVLDQLNDGKNEELKGLRKKVHNLQTMLTASRKSNKKLAAIARGVVNV